MTPQPQPPKPTSTKGPLGMRNVGIALLALAVASVGLAIWGGMGVLAMTNAFVDTTNTADDGTYLVVADELEAGTRYAVCSPSSLAPSDVAVRAGADGSGEELDVDNITISIWVTNHNRSCAADVSFTAPTNGAYTITIASSAASLPASAIGLVREAPFEAAPIRIVAMTLGIVGAILCGGLGLGLTIGGGLWLRTRRGRARLQA